MSELKRLERILDRANTAKQRHKASEDLAEFFLSRGEYHTALDYYKVELEAAVELQDDHKIAKAHRMIGEVLVELSEFDEALKHTMKYHDYACGDDGRLIELQRAYTTLGRTYLIKAEGMKDRSSTQCHKVYNHARDSLWKSLELCQKLKNQIPITELNDMTARSLLNLGLTYEGLGKIDQAIEQFDVAIRLCRKGNIDSMLRPCCLSLASLYVRRGMFQKAFELYKEAHGTIKLLPEKERIRSAVDILFAESDGHMWKGDVHIARKVLQKAYKMQRASSTRDDVVERLKHVAAMDFALKKLEDQMLSAEEKSKQYENLGDGFAGVGIYKSAYENYKKMLEHAKMANINLRPCYISLANTCKDLKDFDKAITYFRKEMSLCDTSEERFDTLLNIQECQVSGGKPPSEQLHTLSEMYEIAEELNSPKFKKIVLTRREKILLASGQHELAGKIKEELEDLGVASESEEEEDEEIEEHTPNIGNYIDLDALSDSEDDEEVNFEETTFSASNVSKPKRNPNLTKAAFRWRNEKGETKLHVACSKGNISAVRTLLEQGHDINAIDYVGWTPLHEACNHGHIEVVEKLLEHGADINTKGGRGTRGITPLYDAAQAGNFEVIEYLLDRNASVAVLTDDGQSALDALVEFYGRSNYLSEEEQRQYDCVKDRLEACLQKSGVPVRKDLRKPTSDPGEDSSVNSKRPSPSAGRLRRIIDCDDVDSVGKKRTMREISPVSSPNAPSFMASDDEKDDDEDNCGDEGKEGVSEYIKAMQNLRKSTDIPSSTEQPASRKPLQPLVNENEIVDSWLENDMGKQPAKKRRKSDHPKQNISSSYRPLSLKTKSTSRLSLNSLSSRPSSTEPLDTARLSLGSRSSRNSETMETSGFSDEGEELVNEENTIFNDSWSLNSVEPPTLDSWPDVRHTNARQTSLLTCGVTRIQTPTPSQMPSQLSAHSRVNVRVENHLFAIYVEDPSLSIGWLAEKAARRFKELDGYQPSLSICSQDGALYSYEDPVKMVLGGDVVGHVKSWNDSSIIERYEEACKSLSSEIDNNVFPLLEASQATHCLDIINTMFTSYTLRPIFRTIAMERNLSRISLSGNCLDDKGVLDMCENLGRLCNLKELDFSGNNISAHAVSALASAATAGHLKNLISLNLGHNNLGDASLPYLVELTASVQLQNLCLCDCMFSKSIWNKTDHFLTFNMLHTLDLSSNQLHRSGLAGFLGFHDHNKERRLNPEKLKHLYLSGVGGDGLCQEVVLFLEQGNSICLREIHLSYPNMQDGELSLLLRILRSAPDLHTVCLPAAQNIRAETVLQLLMHQPALKRLEVHNSKDIWKGIEESDVELAMRHAAHSLETLTLREVPIRAQEAWCDASPNATVKRGAFNLSVFSKQ